jgi:uncharacterized membrane protein YhaH (DUF805 family)
MNWYLEVLKKYAVFSGRASRREYWMFFLFNLIFAIVAAVLDNVLGLAIRDVGTLLPGLAVGIRRLHDIGKSGWYMLMGFIPCVGGIIVLVFFATQGDMGTNEYGPDPYEFG